MTLFDVHLPHWQGAVSLSPTFSPTLSERFRVPSHTPQASLIHHATIAIENLERELAKRHLIAVG